MAYDLEEQESLAEIKAWWEKWGNLILTVVTVACLCAAGFQGWRWYQQRQAESAAALYSQMEAGDWKRVRRQMEEDLAEYYAKVEGAVLVKR